MAKTSSKEDPKKRTDKRETWTVRPTVPSLASTADPALAAILLKRAEQYQLLFSTVREVPERERNAYILRLMLQGYLAEQTGTLQPAPDAPPPVEWGPVAAKSTPSTEPPPKERAPKGTAKQGTAKQGRSKTPAPPPPPTRREDDPALDELG